MHSSFFPRKDMAKYASMCLYTYANAFPGVRSISTSCTYINSLAVKLYDHKKTDASLPQHLVPELWSDVRDMISCSVSLRLEISQRLELPARACCLKILKTVCCSWLGIFHTAQQREWWFLCGLSWFLCCDHLENRKFMQVMKSAEMIRKCCDYSNYVS